MNGCEKATRTMGQTIRRLRMEQNLTQETLAELLGVTSQAVSKWENGMVRARLRSRPLFASTDEKYDTRRAAEEDCGA